MPKVNHDFNQAEYVKNYHREHYKQITTVFAIEEAERVAAAAAAAGMTKSSFIKAAVMEKIGSKE